jgi:hypothetical protein
MVTYGAKTWTQRTGNEQVFGVFKRRMVIKIYGPLFMNGECRLRSNPETESILGHADIVTFVKSRRSSQLGHVQCVDDHHMAKKNLNGELCGRKKRE